MGAFRHFRAAAIGLIVAVMASGISAQGTNEKTRKDVNGDPLPSGAIARLGSVGLRHLGATHVQFVHDGNAILSGNAIDGIVRLWDVKSGKELRQFPGSDFFLAPDGKVLVTWNDVFHIWDLATGTEFAASPFGSSKAFFSFELAISPDANSLVLAGDLRADVGGGAASSAKIETWDIKTGKRTGEWLEKNRRTYPGIRLSPDGRLVFFFGSGLHETLTGKLVNEFQPNQVLGARPIFSPDSKMIIAPKEKGERIGGIVRDLIALDFVSGKQRYDLAGTMYGFFSGDGTRFAAVEIGGGGNGFERSVRVVDAATGKQVQQLRVILNTDRHYLLSPNGRLLVCADYDKIHIWDVDKGTKVREIACALSQNARMDISPNSKTLAVAAGSKVPRWEEATVGVRLWDMATGRRIAQHGEHDTFPVSLAFAPDSKTLASMDDDSVTLVWNTRTGKQLERLEPVPKGPISPDGFLDNLPFGRPTLLSGPQNKWFAIGQAGALVRLVDLTGRAHARSFGSVEAPVEIHAVAADGSILADCSGKTIRLWDVESGRERFSIPWGGEFDPKIVNQSGLPMPPVLAFSPDGRLVAAHGYRSGAIDKQVESITLWETAGGAERHRFDWEVGPTSWSKSRKDRVPVFKQIRSPLIIAPDNRTLAMVSGPEKVGGPENSEEPETIRLWDVVKNQELRRVGGPVLANSVAFSPDAKLLAALTKKGELCLWEVDTGTILRLLSGPAKFTCFRFSFDGNTVATGCEDTSILLWDLKQLMPATHTAAAKDSLQKLWTDLASGDGATAGRAILALRERNAEGVAFLKERLRPIGPIDNKRLQKLVADLESEQFATRSQATNELLKLGNVAVAALKQAAQKKMTLEGQRRVEKLLETLEGPINDPKVLRYLRAIEVLEHVGSGQARAVLDDLAGGMAEHCVTTAARASSARLAYRKAP